MAYGRGDGPGFAAGLLGSIFIAFGISFAGVMIGSGIAEAPITQRSLTVTGVAEREVKANLSVWPMTITATAEDLALLQADIDRDVGFLTSFLVGLGFDEAEISIGRLVLEDRLAESENGIVPLGGRYVAHQPVQVRSNNVDLVAQASRQLGDVTRQGVVLSGVEKPAFIYSRLSEVKADMLSEAATSARDAAQQFADQSGSRLGGITNADQGKFEILPRDEVPGESETSQIFKRVRIVATVTYQLEV
jgi:hypothetical protein